MVITEALTKSYEAGQTAISYIFSPAPPPPHSQLSRPRIAIIGAGLTGVSAAAHCVGHGFDVRIFEARGPQNLGGIWSRVNKTSSLQIHSLMYRFHPSVKWDNEYPAKDQILEQIRKLWQDYGLEEKTLFYTPVLKVEKDKDGLWRINGSTDMAFDGIIAAVGTCGDVSMPSLPNEGAFHGDIMHSSKLDGKVVKGKKVVIVGGGASAVEALEYCVHKDAADVKILARTDKWIIPRNPVVDVLLSLNVFGHETMLSFIPEAILRRFFYRDLSDIAPQKGGLFTSTPMVNDDILDQIRAGKAEWCRGDVQEIVKEGVKFNKRRPGVPKGGPGTEDIIDADIIIKATGFHRPSLRFLPEHCFDEPYSPPSWYLQTFPPTEPSVCANNCSYVNAIGTVGNYHIGIYTRLLLVFLIDPLTRPRERWMKIWVDMTRFLKSGSPTGAFEFFTYGELIFWFCFCVAINPFRWKWALFVFFGIGSVIPMAILDEEDRAREKLGIENGTEH